MRAVPTYRGGLEILERGTEGWRSLTKKRWIVEDRLGQIIVDECWMQALMEKVKRIARWEPRQRHSRGRYLYDGTGNPWAGHSNVIAPPSAILNACKSANDENFGRVLATGSKGCTKKHLTKKIRRWTRQNSYYFSPRGFLWQTAHRSAYMHLRSSDDREFSVPEGWNGERLSWTHQSERLVAVDRVRTRVLRHRELRFRASHRF